MILSKLKKQFNNSSDLIVKKINNITVCFLESVCDSNKLNEFIFKNLRVKTYYSLRNLITGPSVVYVDKYDKLDDTLEFNELLEQLSELYGVYIGDIYDINEF